jgi:drug/metabolite transporter (DMT)-like permease
MLGLISWRRLRDRGRSGAGLWSATALFMYMILFSFAYLSLGAGTGALILFGAVQLTMFARALRDGEHFPWLSWMGLLLAVSGLVYLVSPGLTAPEPLGAISMALAGVAWGVYSLQGKRASDPLAATASNFLYCVPMVLCVSLVFAGRIDVTASGILLAAASGALASGAGYAIWYAALGGLSAARAATVQLSVPVIAAIGGVVILAEPLTLRLVVASAATLGGVSLVLGRRAKSGPAFGSERQ